MNQKIGKVSISYDENGKVTSATFEPTIEVQSDEGIMEQLKTLENPQDSKVIQSNADLILASWFNKAIETLTEIEESDREKYYVKSSIPICENYPNGKVKTCVIEYDYVDR